jgi:hypothetical protein
MTRVHAVTITIGLTCAINAFDRTPFGSSPGSNGLRNFCIDILPEKRRRYIVVRYLKAHYIVGFF